MAKTAIKKKQPPAKKNKKNSRDYYKIPIVFLTAIALTTLIPVVANLIAAKPSAQGTCGRDSSGNVTYTAPLHYRPAKILIYSLLLLAVLLIVAGLYKFNSRKYKALVLVAETVIILGTILSLLGDAVGTAVQGIQCIPF